MSSIVYLKVIRFTYIIIPTMCSYILILSELWHELCAVMNAIRMHIPTHLPTYTGTLVEMYTSFDKLLK